MRMVGHRVMRGLVRVLMLFVAWRIHIVVVTLIVLVVFGVLRVFDAVVVMGTELSGELRAVVLANATKTMVSGRW